MRDCVADIEMEYKLSNIRLAWQHEHDERVRLEERLKRAEAEIAQLQAENAALREAKRGTPTAERPPHEFEQVIGWYGDRAAAVWWQFEAGVRTWWEADGEEVGEPSHWWPVPEPPEPANG